jgi:hypothetical protein
VGYDSEAHAVDPHWHLGDDEEFAPDDLGAQGCGGWLKSGGDVREVDPIRRIAEVERARLWRDLKT